MRAAEILRTARRRAGFSQRQLARLAGVPQSTVARIETGAVDPASGMLLRLVRMCGADLELAQLLGVGVDRSQLRRRLALSPRERIEEHARALASVELVRRAKRVG